jgi:hypothetical protein
VPHIARLESDFLIFELGLNLGPLLEILMARWTNADKYQNTEGGFCEIENKSKEGLTAKN